MFNKKNRFQPNLPNANWLCMPWDQVDDKSEKIPKNNYISKLARDQSI